MKKILFVYLVFQVLSSFAFADLCQEVKKDLQVGDLIFIESKSSIFEKVGVTQNHWATHVGMAIKNSWGDWMVAESTIPLSKFTPLCRYVKGGAKTRLGVKRFQQEFNVLDETLLYLSARKRMGILYDLGFNFDSALQYCSKFIAHVYDEALDLEVGEIESFEELFADTRDPSILDFWKAWFRGPIPWERRTLTPASLYRDPQFFTVLEFEAE